MPISKKKIKVLKISKTNCDFVVNHSCEKVFFVCLHFLSAVCLQFPDMTSLSRNGSYPDDSKTENLGDLYTKIKDADQSSFPDGTKNAQK